MTPKPNINIKIKYYKEWIDEKMKTLKSQKMWRISLLVVSVTKIINSISAIIGIDLPDNIVRGLGVITIVFIPILVYSTINTFKK